MRIDVCLPIVSRVCVYTLLLYCTIIIRDTRPLSFVFRFSVVACCIYIKKYYIVVGPFCVLYYRAGLLFVVDPLFCKKKKKKPLAEKKKSVYTPRQFNIEGAVIFIIAGAKYASRTTRRTAK